MHPALSPTVKTLLFFCRVTSCCLSPCWTRSFTPEISTWQTTALVGSPFFCFKRRFIRSCTVGWSDINFSQRLVVFLVCWCGQWYSGWRRLRGFLAPEISSQGSQGISRDFKVFFPPISKGFRGIWGGFNQFQWVSEGFQGISKFFFKGFQ